MSGLALAKALHSRFWVPKHNLELAKPSALHKIAPKPASDRSDQLRAQLQLPQSLTNSKGPSQVELQKEAPIPIKAPAQSPLSAQVKNQTVNTPKEPTKAQVAAPLCVQGPAQFQVAATMVSENFGVVVPLPFNTGLAGDDYVMLSKLINACRHLVQTPLEPTEFVFFRWPPGRGLAPGLDSQQMALSALKGFLHKMANKRQCSWLVFDETFARFCFQRESLKVFDALPNGSQKLFVAPRLVELKQDAALKQKLWNSLKVGL